MVPNHQHGRHDATCSQPILKEAKNKEKLCDGKVTEIKVNNLRKLND